MPANAPLVPVGLSCDDALMRYGHDQDDNEEDRVVSYEELEESGITCIGHLVPPYVYIPPSDVPASKWIAEVPVTE